MTGRFEKIFGRKTWSILLIVLAITIATSQAWALTWQGPMKVPMVPSLAYDGQVKFVDAAPSNGTVLKTDTHIKYVERGVDTNWDPGETVVYDLNNNTYYDTGEPVSAGTIPANGNPLRLDAKLKFVDVNSNNVWDAGEPVVWDSNNNNAYDYGEPVVAGTPPALQAALTNDGRIKFVDVNGNSVRDPGEPVVYDSSSDGYYNATTDAKVKFVNSTNIPTETWAFGKAVVYDRNNNNVYDSGDSLIAGNPGQGASLKADPRFRYIDTNHNYVWNVGEAVVYDTSSNNAPYGPGDPLVAGVYPANQTVLSNGASNQTANKNRIAFSDTNGNNQWDPGEPVAWDSNNDKHYSNSSDAKIMYYDPDRNAIYDTADTVIYDTDGNGVYEGTGPGAVDPFIGTIGTGGLPQSIDCPCPLAQDIHFRFIDANRVGSWQAGDTVVYDVNNNNIYDSGELAIGGAAPPVGTPLVEPVIAGASPGIGSPLKIDPRLRFVDSNFNGVWDPGEAVVYDSNNGGLYDAGEPVVVGSTPALGTLLGEPVISGPVPSVGTSLKTDQRIRFIDSNGNGVWDTGEVVVYDSDNAFPFRYNTGEPVLAGGATSWNGRWDGSVTGSGEVSVYDSNNNWVYDLGEPVVSGSAPVPGTPLQNDPHIKFIDSNGNSRWDSVPLEIVVYDLNNNSFYDPGEPVLTGQAPATKIASWPSASSDPYGRLWLAWYEKTAGSTQAPDVYFKIWNGTTWLNKQQVTTDTHNDTTESITLLSNQTMMIVWSSDRAGSPRHPQLFYKLYSTTGTNPQPTTGEIQLTASSSLYDSEPGVVQDRAGRIWVVWTRHDARFLTSDIYYKFFNGTAWSADFNVPTASGATIQERSPTITQTKDGKIWVAFASNNTGSTGNTNIFYTTTDGTVPILPSTNTLSWSTPVNSLASGDDDEHPSIVQASDGLIWIFYHKSPLTTAPDTISAASSSDNGQSWSINQFTPGPSVGSPAATLLSGSLWVFWVFTGGSPQEIWVNTSNRVGVHDVGVRTLSWTPVPPAWLPGHVIPPAFPGVSRSGDTLNVTVTIQNYGNYTEPVTLTVKLNSTSLTPAPLTLSLPSYNITTIRISWNSSLAPVKPFWGRYVLTATVTENAGLGVELPINQSDNSVNSWLVRISAPGDVNGNGKVDILDASILAFEFDSKASDPTSKYWLNPNADLDRNGVINILDASILAFYFGKSV